MSNRIVTFSPTARQKLIEGVNTLAKAVGVTLGPRGRNVVIDTYGSPAVTKDGVTVAREIRLDDPIESLGANIVKQAAARTAATAGDGTTTATVIAQALINNGSKLVEQGVSPIDIKRSYENLLKTTLEQIELQSKPVTMENVKQIATISANNDPSIGELIYEGFSFVGTNGMLTVEDSKTGQTYVSLTEGTKINSGWVSPYMITEPTTMEAIYSNPFILITDRKVRTTQELVPVLEIARRAGRPLLIIADEIEAQALNLLVVNRMTTGLPVVAIKAPAYGERRQELLKDLAILTNAELITEAKAIRLESVTQEHLGTADKIQVSKDHTLIVNPNPNGTKYHLDQRILEIQSLLSQPQDHIWITEKLEERLSNLTGKVAVFYVGASTETELKEKKDRIDDALRATKSAIAKGFVEGGGMTLLRISTLFDNQDPIQQAFKSALISPYELILKNANLTPSYDTTLGTNALTGITEDLEAAGVIDPTLVITEAVTNGVSAANMILLSEVTVHDIKPKFENTPLDQYAN